VGEHGEPAFTHPQSMLKRLLRIMRRDREDVRECGALSPELAARRALVAQALRPADSAEVWREFREKESASLFPALRGVSCVEAPDERLEALSLALYMREALETPGRTAALITPDRAVARRVAAELARFDLEIEDSGGEPLGATPIGALARQLAAIAQQGAGAVEVAALLAHPMATFGLERGSVSALAPLIEIAVLRAVPLSSGGWAAAVEGARVCAQDAHAYPLTRRLSEADWEAIRDLLARIDAALAPLLAPQGEAPLAARVKSLRASLEAVAAASGDAAPAPSRGMEEFLALLDRLEGADAPLDFDASSFAAFIDALLFEIVLRGPRRAHPRLKIFGLLEARLVDADLVLLGGLDEGVWPPQADSGAFLNRAMREQLGLSPPERRIGQSAHDLTMALGARDVVIARAKKRDGSPTVASRFVTRLAALAGDAFLDCKARGDRILALAAALDAPQAVAACARPEPRPPLELRPRQLSVTRIETLRRDPYAIYAERILELAPLEPLGAEPGAREMGTAVHAALAEFIRAHPQGPLPEDGYAILLRLAQDKLGCFLTDPGFAAFKWPRVTAGLEHALAFERTRRAGGGEIFVEERGEWRFALRDGSEFKLTCFADRIEVESGGAAEVFDYKTGAPPTNPQVCAGFAPQLTLESAMLASGAFARLGRREARGAAYVRIGGDGSGEALWIKAKDMSFGALVAEHRAQLLELLNQFRDPLRTYPSRPYVAFASRYGDYDNLARVKEWSREGGAEG
jgi:ATP-dependent helicase/nuclease subunit B